VATGIERPRLIGDIVLEKIRDAIVSHRLKPGERVSEAGVAAMLAVSKTPVREALIRLRAIGLVVAEDGALRVVQASPQLIRDVYETRANADALLAELATVRGSKADKVALLDTAQRLTDSAAAYAVDEFAEAEAVLHTQIERMSANAFASDNARAVRDLSRGLQNPDLFTPKVTRACGEAYASIAQVIHDGDINLARTRTTSYVHYLMNTMLAVEEPVVLNDPSPVFV